MVNFLVGNYVSHAVVKHVEAIVAGSFKCLVEKVKSAIVECSFDPIVIIGVQIRKFNSVSVIANDGGDYGSKSEIHCNGSELNAGCDIRVISSLSVRIHCYSDPSVSFC